MDWLHPTGTDRFGPPGSLDQHPITGELHHRAAISDLDQLDARSNLLTLAIALAIDPHEAITGRFRIEMHRQIEIRKFGAPRLRQLPAANEVLARLGFGFGRWLGFGLRLGPGLGFGLDSAPNSRASCVDESGSRFESGASPGVDIAGREGSGAAGFCAGAASPLRAPAALPVSSDVVSRGRARTPGPGHRRRRL